MRFSIPLLASAIILATSTLAIAATTTDITIKVIEPPIVSFTGSLSGDATPTLTLANVNNVTGHILGTLGSTSNFTGLCNISVTSDEDFRLKHTTNTTDTYLHGTGKYTVKYGLYTFESGSLTNNTFAQLCQSANSNVTLDTPAVATPVAAGTYQDILHVAIAVQ